MNILIVDDSDIIRKAITTSLSKIDVVASFREVTSVSKARVLINDYQPDIVFLEIHLHRGKGLDLLQYIKKNFPKIKVIILTNDNFGKYRKISKQLGADYFFDKSTEFEKINSAVTEISLNSAGFIKTQQTLKQKGK
ncbi:MAG: response regulator [Candidatus Neomarinimicrobiota bacterium]